MNDERDDSEDEMSNEVGELRGFASQLSSKKEFLLFLEKLSSLCTDDEECWERRVVHFVDVVED